MKRLKEEVIQQIKKQKSDLHQELMQYYGNKSISVWILADRNESPKLHEWGALKIMEKHLGVPVEELLYKEEEVCDGVV